LGGRGAPGRREPGREGRSAQERRGAASGAGPDGVVSQCGDHAAPDIPSWFVVPRSFDHDRRRRIEDDPNPQPGDLGAADLGDGLGVGVLSLGSTRRMTHAGATGQSRGIGGSPLLERERELDLFAALIADPGGDASGVIVVEGPPGIGKSRLIAALREQAASAGVTVLSGVGSDLEREFPYGVVRQLFEPLLANPDDRAALLDGAAAPARSVFEGIASADDAEGDVSFAALHGLYWLTVNAASAGPLMLVIDDLHWCDRPSLRFLTYLVRRLEGLGTLIVLGLRTAEPGTDPVMTGDLAAHPDALHLHPAPLSDSGIAALIAERLEAAPEPAFVAACREATGGNPLLLRQLLTSLASDRVVPEAAQAEAVERVGPRAVSRTVLQRLRRLPDGATAVAQAVAVLGSQAELPHVAALSSLAERDVARATAALAQAEILRPEPPLRFVHPLVRDAVYHQLPPGERELRHARAADVLISGQAPAEEVATQLVAAPRRGRADVVALLREAASAARHKGASESAVAYLQRALEEPPGDRERVAVLVELGRAEVLTSGPAAATHLREAWEATAEPGERARLAATLATTLIFTEPGHEARAVLNTALSEIPDELADERQALLALQLMAVYFGPGSEELMDGVDAIEVVGDGPGAKMLLAIKAHSLTMLGAHYDDVLPIAERALADDVLIEADPGLFPPAAINALSLAHSDAALEAWDRLRERAHRGGSLLGVLTLGLWRGVTLIWRGDLREAEELLENAVEDFIRWGLIRAGETYGPAFLGAARLRRGKLASARELLDPSGVEDPQTDGYRHLLRFWCEVLLAEGRYDEALAVADDLAQRLPFIVNPGWAPWRSLKAQALDGLGRTDEAIVKREDGLRELTEAVALLEMTNARYDLARILLALGGTLRRARRPTDAREPLRRALELADQCGADGLADEARTELHASGARPRTTALGGVESLTASERRVAELAAGGQSNREIAQTLYVTPKTVEVHLSNAYRKLGIRSRQELPRALAA
jgi:DNA-binding CsgD family transcriptional regulator